MSFNVQIAGGTAQPQLLITIEVQSPLPIRKHDERMLADWDAVRWADLVDIADHLVGLCSRVIDVRAEDLRRELFEQPRDSYVRIGAEIHLVGHREIPVEMRNRLAVAVSQFLVRIHARGNSMRDDLGLGADAAPGEVDLVAQECAAQFLDTHSGRRIKAPFRVTCGTRIAEMSGGYLSVVLPAKIEHARRTVVGTVDSLGVTARQVGIRPDGGKNIALAYDHGRHFETLRAYLGNRQLYEIVVEDGADIKGHVVSTLIGVGNEVVRKDDLFG